MSIKKNKKVLILNLNEANFDFILKYAKKYNNENILEFLKNKNIYRVSTLKVSKLLKISNYIL